MKLVRPLFLLGMMGSGKSTLSRALATQYGWSRVALDEMIIAAAGKDIPTIFAQDGEDTFRDHEAQALAAVLGMSEATVIDTGGGVIDWQSNRDLLTASTSDRCYLNVAVPVLLARIDDTSSRPMLRGEDPASSLRHLAERRDRLYRDVATIVVDVNINQTVAETTAAIIARMEL